MQGFALQISIPYLLFHVVSSALNPHLSPYKPNSSIHHYRLLSFLNPFKTVLQVSPAMGDILPYFNCEVWARNDCEQLFVRKYTKTYGVFRKVCGEKSGVSP